MTIDLLRVAHLRCFDEATFEPGPAVNWLVGANGTGKTTLLEATYILSHGRSFRAGGRTAPCRRGASEYLIHAEISQARGSRVRLGLTRGTEGWRARLDGVELTSLAPLFGACRVVWFGPESSSLVLGPAEERRGFLDWSVFHVEHASLEVWRRWRRALRQRNALLRSGAPDDAFGPWERELDSTGGRIHAMRGACLASLAPYFSDEAASLVPELGRVGLEYRAGWDEDAGLGAHLAAQRDRDRERGFTQVGAHRADWTLRFDRVAQREHLSRGQAKAVALVCALALTRWLKNRLGEYPLLCLDDLDSELDALHVSNVTAWLHDKPLQAWITTTADPATHRLRGNARVFHVEHGGVSPA